MFDVNNIIAQPAFFLFVAGTFLLAIGYFQGRRRNRAIVFGAFEELAEVLQPQDQTYTNIGGAIGYHADIVPHKGSVVSKAQVTLTLLPRQSWLYLPISLLLRRWDRLYLTLHMSKTPPSEGHLIDAGYHRFRAPAITNESRMKQETVEWGGRHFLLLYMKKNTRDHFARLMEALRDPAGIKHIAFVPHQKRCFVFMVPYRRTVKASLGPVFGWLETVV